MFKKKESENPEVLKAQADHEKLMAGVDDVVAAAKKVTDELTRQYEEAEQLR